MLLSADYAHENGPGEGVPTYRSTSAVSCDPFIGCGVPPFFFPPGPGFIQTENAALGITASPRNVLQASNFLNSTRFTVYGVSLKIDYELGGGYTLTNVIGQRGNSQIVNNDGCLVPAFDCDTEHTGYHYEQQTEELRLASPSDGRFTFQGGLFYLHLHAGDDAIGNADYALGPPPPPFKFYTENNLVFQMPDTRSVAVYFEGVYKLLDSLRLTAGARYTHDTLHYGVNWFNPPLFVIPFFPCPIAAGNNQITGGDCFQFNQSDTHNDISYRFSLDYDIAPNVMAYVSYAKGYKGPTFNQLNAAPVAPEIPKDVELGVKSTLFGDKLRLNVDVFHETFHGFQAQVVVESNGIINAETVNAGQLLSRGVEAEFTAIPFNGLTLDGGVTYNATEFSGLPPIQCYPAQPSGFGPNQCNPSGPFAGAFFANGDPLNQAPLWTETFTARYQQPLWSGWDGFIQADGHIQSSFNFTIGTNPNTRLDGTSIFGLATGAQTDDGRIVLTLFVRNLFDRRIPSYIEPAIATGVVGDGVGPGTTGDWLQQFSENSFRTVGFSLDYHM